MPSGLSWRNALVAALFLVCAGSLAQADCPPASTGAKPCATEVISQLGLGFGSLSVGFGLRHYWDAHQGWELRLEKRSLEGGQFEGMANYVFSLPLRDGSRLYALAGGGIMVTHPQQVGPALDFGIGVVVTGRPGCWLVPYYLREPGTPTLMLEYRWAYYHAPAFPDFGTAAGWRSANEMELGFVIRF